MGKGRSGDGQGFKIRTRALFDFRIILVLTTLAGAGVESEPTRVQSPCASPGKIRSLEETIRTLDPCSPLASQHVPSLTTVVASPHCPAVLRQRAGMLLGRIGMPASDAVPVLIGLLDGVDRPWAMKSLGLFGEVAAPAVGQLASELRDESRGIEDRILVADVLGQVSTGPAIEALGRELLRDGSLVAVTNTGSQDAAGTRLLRKTMLDAIALAGPKAVGALPALLRSLEDPDSETRRKACQAIGQLGPRAEPAIDSVVERLALDEAAEVQDAAAETLGQLGTAAVPVLIRVLRDAPPDLQWRAAKSLGRFGETWLGPGRLDPTRRLGTASEEVARELTLLFESKDARVRIESIEAVWRIQRRADAVALPLVAELNSIDRENKKTATRVLIELPDLPDDVRSRLQELRDGSSSASRPASEILRQRTLRATRQTSSGKSPVPDSPIPTD